MYTNTVHVEQVYVQERGPPAKADSFSLYGGRDQGRGGHTCVIHITDP